MFNLAGKAQPSNGQRYSCQALSPGPNLALSQGKSAVGAREQEKVLSTQEKSAKTSLEGFLPATS
jgi:hypothetical protein